jgi:hypothetical protein
MKESKIIAIDFDGTCVTHNYPEMGFEIGAALAIKELVSKGHRIILFTMRSGDALAEAVNWFTYHDIPLFGVNKNPEQFVWTTSPKPYAHLYIDDAAFGVPLVYPGIDKRPFVDWTVVCSSKEYKELING